MMILDGPRRPLIGDAGQLIHSSPCNRYQIWRAVIPTFPAEAIVNATNKQMILNTSVVPGGEFQIIRDAGNGLKEHLHKKFGSGSGLPTGDAITTPSFEMMNCWYLIHVNGPNYRTRTRKTLPLLRQQLADCYRRCLEEAEKHGIRSLAFPCISTGATLGWPRVIAARIGIDTIRRWFSHPIFGPQRMERIPGPIFLLADPFGPYSHQEEAWLVAFNEFFPASELPPPPRVVVSALPQADRPILGRQRRTKISSVPTLKREDAFVGPRIDSVGAGPDSAPKRKRGISDRELRSLNDGHSQADKSLEDSMKRPRKPPRRFGQDD